MIHAHTNSLANQTSPYLLQHAHNPVQWYAWGEEALQKAQKENKLLLISIGYSSCHWCHVMAHECFENDSVAAVMNQYYVNVKIDREERPDLDNYYMGALQLMTGRGGWPLNIVALPDGRPVWGATYVPKEKWVEALQTVNNLYQTDPNRVVEYAENLAAGIAQSEQIAPLPPQTDFTTSFLAEAVTNWKTRFDSTDGGPNKAPKFPLPANYTFLLRYGFLADDKTVTDHLKLTLKKMAMGGIYDQIGGGFARYSVDAHWKVPHFEKMLYDNAQLISLYAEAYKNDQKPLYNEVVSQSINFLNREMRGSENQYFSALDADTEGEEGKYYTWQKPELQALIAAKEWPLFEKYYNINTAGFWEHGQYILLRTQTDTDFAQQHKISVLALRGYVNGWQKTLLAARQKRTAPGLDHKALTAWNALTISALVDAYTAFGESEYLDDAVKTAHFISQKMTKQDGALWHTYTTDAAKINGFLDDYAFLIGAYLKLYGATADVSWLEKAEMHTQFVLQHFDAGANALFYFTAEEDAFLSRSLESSDNVIPASNSAMAHNLHTLGVLQNRPEYVARAKTMLGQITDQMPRYAEGYGNWASLFLQFAYPSYEVAICGPNAKRYYLQMQSKFAPNALFVFTEKPSDAPLFKDRFVKDGNTYIYVCQDYACKLPVKTVDEAWRLMMP